MSRQVALSQDIVKTGTLMMWEFGNQSDVSLNRKLQISLRFLARTIRQLDCISNLVHARFVSDGWILFRSLMERYLLFVHLCDNKEFDVFDDWCFKERYEQLNRIKSIRDFKDRPELRRRRFSAAEKTRYGQVSSDPSVCDWRRPDMETVARRHRMKFLYDAGYDYGSAYVHPVATDGMDDYFYLMGRTMEANTDMIPILGGNACLISVLHIQHFMNEPEFNWRNLLYDLLDAFKKMAGGQACEYAKMLQKVQDLHMSRAGLLSKKPGTL